MSLAKARHSPEKKPIELWLEALEGNKYWDNYDTKLRKRSNDSHIVGYEYSPIGILCDLFLEHSEEAKKLNAHWDLDAFCWNNGKYELKYDIFFPPPVLFWLGIKENGKIIRILIELAKKRTACDHKAAAMLIRSHI